MTAPTLGQLRVHAAKLATDEAIEILCGAKDPNDPLPKAALASILEQAFTEQPPRGPTYPEEFRDLCSWIHHRSRDAGCPMYERLLALVFDDFDLVYESGKLDPTEEDEHPVIRDAHRDLIRAVAVYFLRTLSYWGAVGDIEDAAMTKGASQ